MTLKRANLELQKKATYSSVAAAPLVFLDT